MSITTMKRKSDASRNISGKSNGGFSLNNPRRVESQHGSANTQTKMRGLGYVGHGGKYGKFPINILKSQYSNTYDPYVGPRASVKNNAGMLSELLRCCDPVVQQTSAWDGETYIAHLKMTATKPDVCDGSYITGSGSTPTNSDCTSETCRKQHNYVKPQPMDYDTYYKSIYLNKRGIPLAAGSEHYPPMVSRVRSGCGSGNYTGLTYEQFKELKSCS
jgi:hypothetical protein